MVFGNSTAKWWLMPKTIILIPGFTIFQPCDVGVFI
jgi:hypothetical protein